jgi:hypothetical protein
MEQGNLNRATRRSQPGSWNRLIAEFRPVDRPSQCSQLIALLAWVPRQAAGVESRSGDQLAID